MAEAYLLNKSINRKAAAALIRRIDSTSYEGDLAYLVKKRCEDCAKYEGRTSGFIQSDLVAMLTAPFTGPKVKVEIMSFCFCFPFCFIPSSQRCLFKPRCKSKDGDHYGCRLLRFPQHRPFLGFLQNEGAVKNNSMFLVRVPDILKVLYLMYGIS